MSEHSVNVLTDGKWVPVGGIMRWQGTHLAQPEFPRVVRRRSARGGKRGVCTCGLPAYSPTALYCLDCRSKSTRESWRKSAAKRRKSVNHGPDGAPNTAAGGAHGTLGAHVNKAAPEHRANGVLPGASPSLQRSDN